MLNPKIVAEVKRLLAEGTLSQRAIARATGVSHGSVGKIASGKRPDYPPKMKAPGDSIRRGRKRRCTTCGGMVYGVCRLCLARETLKAGGRKVVAEPPKADCELELRGKNLARYQEIHRQKEADEDQTVGEWLPPTIAEGDLENAERESLDAA